MNRKPFRYLLEGKLGHFEAAFTYLGSRQPVNILYLAQPPLDVLNEEHTPHVYTVNAPPCLYVTSLGAGHQNHM